MCFEPTGLTKTKAAEHLMVSRQALNTYVNEKAARSPDTAIRLEKAFGLTAEMWLSMQLAFDLAQASKRAPTIRVKAFAAA